MLTREVPALSITILKEIAKTPVKYVSADSFERASRINSTKSFDLAQVLVDYVIEAGRLTDDVLPVPIFAGRTTLSLKNSKISSRYLKKIISVAPGLTVLDLSGTFLVDDDSVLTALQTCPSLGKLGLQNCRKLTDASLVSIARFGGSLYSLQLGGNFNITLAGIQAFLDSSLAPQLRELHLSGLPITDDVVLAVAKKCPNLQKISFGYCNVTEAALRRFFDTIGHQLESVSVAWIGASIDHPDFQISADFIAEFLARSCPRLVELDICGLKQIYVQNILQFLDNKLHQSEGSGPESVPLKLLKAKFVGSSKAQLEQTIYTTHPYLKLML